MAGVVEVALDGASAYVGVGHDDVFPGRAGYLVEVLDAVIGKAVADGQYLYGVVLSLKCCRQEQAQGEQKGVFGFHK